MDLGLTKKVVLVTAASRGLGKAVATEFAREGAHVMIASRNESQLQQAVNEIQEATNGVVEYCVTDLSTRAGVDNLITKTVEHYGRLDVLVTNTGGPPAGKFDDFEDDVWERVFQSNLMNVVRLVRGALPHMRQNGGGRILNITSTSIKQPIEGLLLSNTFRAGIYALAKTLAAELAPDNILVNTIAPGRIDTDRVAELDAGAAERTGRTTTDVRAAHEANIPLGRYGTPEEFARVALFYGSSANTYVTGQALLVDGGMIRGL